MRLPAPLLELSLFILTDQNYRINRETTIAIQPTIVVTGKVTVEYHNLE
jgi:hypothetical protein